MIASAEPTSPLHPSPPRLEWNKEVAALPRRTRRKNWPQFNSGEVLILVVGALILLTLIILVPRLLHAHHQMLEMQHTERMRALEQNQPLPPIDERSRVAGRTAMLVPMVVIISAATVTCFLVAYKSEHLFAVSLAVWSVAGVVSLAAITGGVALIGRLAQLHSGIEEEEPSRDNPV